MNSGVFCFFLMISSALIGVRQAPPSQDEPQKKKIYIVHSDSTLINRSLNPDGYIMKGNVVFRHDSTYLYCDSAYTNTIKNSLEAFSKVRIEQGDTLSIVSDYMIYEGDVALAKMRDNVIMENNDVTLFTDSFNYDRMANLAYFFDGGMLVDSLNELSSAYGQYSPESKEAFFKNEVQLTNPQFVLNSDTLRYNTFSKLATILGPSVIESDSGIIHSTRGWYNTVTEQSMLYDRSTVISNDKCKTITADSLSYNRLDGIAEAYGNMIMNDTLKKVILQGNYGFFDDPNGFAFSTDSAFMIEYSQGDSLYAHADTFKMQTIGENQRLITAYYGVRAYRSDLQCVSDSLQFNTADSTLTLYTNPVMWAGEYQLVGDTIRILFNDSTIDQLHSINYAFALQNIDTTYYNQVKGKLLVAYFLGKEVSRIEVSGSTESIYYVLDQGVITMRNKTESAYLNIRDVNKEVKTIVGKPEARVRVVPIPQLTSQDKFLKDFVDYDYLRPHDKTEIFVKKNRKVEDIPPPRRKGYQADQ